MDLVCEGAAPAALDERQPRHGHSATPASRDRKIRVRVTGVQRSGAVGRYQDPGHGLQGRILAVHTLLAQLPHRAVHSGVRSPPGHVEVRCPHGFGSPGARGVRTQRQQEAPCQQSGKAAATAGGDPGPWRRPHGARAPHFPLGALARTLRDLGRTRALTRCALGGAEAGRDWPARSQPAGT